MSVLISRTSFSSMLLAAMTDPSSFRRTTRSESTKLPSGGHGRYINMSIGPLAAQARAGVHPRRGPSCTRPQGSPAGRPDHQWVGGPKGVGVDAPRLRATRGNDYLNAHMPCQRRCSHPAYSPSSGVDVSRMTLGQHCWSSTLWARRDVERAPSPQASCDHALRVRGQWW